MAITWTRFTNAAGTGLAARSIQGTTTALTESAPSASTDGIDLTGVDSVVVSIAAPAAQTFDGVGALLAYRWHDLLAAWRPAPEFDLDMSDANGRANMDWASIGVGHKEGRLAYVPSSVGVSGGTALVISLIASYGAGAHPL